MFSSGQNTLNGKIKIVVSLLEELCSELEVDALLHVFRGATLTHKIEGRGGSQLNQAATMMTGYYALIIGQHVKPLIEELKNVSGDISKVSIAKDIQGKFKKLISCFDEDNLVIGMASKTLSDSTSFLEEINTMRSKIEAMHSIIEPDIDIDTNAQKNVTSRFKH